MSKKVWRVYRTTDDFCFVKIAEYPARSEGQALAKAKAAGLLNRRDAFLATTEEIKPYVLDA